MSGTLHHIHPSYMSSAQQDFQIASLFSALFLSCMSLTAFIMCSAVSLLPFAPSSVSVSRVRPTIHVRKLPWATPPLRSSSILPNFTALHLAARDRHFHSHSNKLLRGHGTVMAGTSASKNIQAGAAQAQSLASRTRGKSAQLAKLSTATAEVQGTQVLLHNAPTTTSEQSAKTLTSTVQKVDVEQSVQIMQTMLYGCLSSVVFQRSIFPPDCYETRYYINNSSQWTYTDYISARQGVIKGDGTGGSILALKKGVSSRVDRFLNLIVCT